jgi:hypothetical protein
MIGRLVAAWQDGRDDARHGRKAMPPKSHGRRHYAAGYHHERGDMRRARRLAQPSLFDGLLTEGDGNG